MRGRIPFNVLSIAVLLGLGAGVIAAGSRSLRPLINGAITRPAGKPAFHSGLIFSEAYGKLPIAFEANTGQADREVKFLSQGNGYTLFLKATEAVLWLSPPAEFELTGNGRKNAAKAVVLRTKLVGASPATRVVGAEELPGKSNYFIGNDPSKWRTNVPNYAKVEYRDVYPGVRMVYYGSQQQLEYDFVVAPGADPNVIRLAVEGAGKLQLDAQGDLVLNAGDDSAGQIRFRKPLLYQEAANGRHEIDGGYALWGNEVSFSVAAYDPTRPLVIDPKLLYSTCLGGQLIFGAKGTGIAVDSAGNAYVTGTRANVLPVNLMREEPFVAKLNAAGTALLYTTYVGGSGVDEGYAIAVDSGGNAYITGHTQSLDFPTVNPFQAAYGGGTTLPYTYGGDAFVAKLNAAGSALLYSTYFGGNADDEGNGIAVDSSGNAYVVGWTQSLNFPTFNPLQAAYGGRVPGFLPNMGDGFVAKFNAAGSALVYSTYLGGSGCDEASAIAVDAGGNAYVTGWTISPNFPTVNPLQATYGGGGPLSYGRGGDAFVAKLNAAGSALVYSTYLGGAGLDAGRAVAVDSDGNAYVTGWTTSANFPTKLQPAYGGHPEISPGNELEGDAFVVKLNAAGSALLYATYLGGSGWDAGYGIAVAPGGSVYVAGHTDSADFPTLAPLDAAYSTGNFIAKLNAAGSALVYSTSFCSISGSGYYGCPVLGVAADTAGAAYVTGWVYYGKLLTASPLTSCSEGSRAFIAKIADTPGAAPLPTINAGGTVNGASFRAQVAAGGLASLFGSNLSVFTWPAGGTPLPTKLGGTSVLMNGIPAPLIYVSRLQINFQVPWEVQGQTQASIVVNVDGVNSTAQSVNLINSDPGVFVVNSAGQAAILISATGELAAASGSIPGRACRPAKRDEWVSIYCTGLGAVSDRPASGAAASGSALSRTATTPTVTIGSLPAEVAFSGLAPGFVGLYQVNARVPANSPTGNAVPLVVTVGGATSNSVFIAVQ
jgi:uncharacterized protein (TIGR03437 family)